MNRQSVIVVGAGVVGLAAAVALVMRGAHVTLIDRSQPGQGCSFGNAGIIAVSESFPIISMERLRGLPATLLSGDGPAVVRAPALPHLAPWLVRAALSMGRARQRAIVAAIAALNRSAVQAWRDLLAQVEAPDLLVERGMLRLARKPRDWTALAAIRDALNALSIPARLVSRDQLGELEPGVGGQTLGALLHETDAQVANPDLVSQALLGFLRGRGALIVCEEALAIEPTLAGARVRTRTGVIEATQVLVTAGLFSGALMKPLGVDAPLQAERGYHLMLPRHGELLTRPVTFHAESCVATPMGDQLRLAGTVEFCNDAARPNWKRSDRQLAIAQRYFDQRLEPSGAGRWVGSRPSLPDSLPALGRLRQHPAIGYAFGHQHLGLTQAAVSAKLLVALMAGEKTEIDWRPYDVARFTKPAAIASEHVLEGAA